MNEEEAGLRDIMNIISKHLEWFSPINDWSGVYKIGNGFRVSEAYNEYALHRYPRHICVLDRNGELIMRTTEFDKEDLSLLASSVYDAMNRYFIVGDVFRGIQKTLDDFL